VVCRDGVPIAEVRPVRPRRSKPRELGFAKGQFEVTDAFFEPLPDGILDAFEGRDPRET
jgi:antitoxin (DNA-binding transcriptional repressor) of toxin-antitoxin stability system